jgi:hypothetical protein
VGWTFVYLMVILKIPIVGLLWIVWWAVKQEPDPAEQPGGDGGVKDRPHPRHPRTPLRHGPRGCDPHGQPLPSSPPRVRVTAARGRPVEH